MTPFDFEAPGNLKKNLTQHLHLLQEWRRQTQTRKQSDIPHPLISMSSLLPPKVSSFWRPSTPTSKSGLHNVRISRRYCYRVTRMRRMISAKDTKKYFPAWLGYSIQLASSRRTIRNLDARLKPWTTFYPSKLHPIPCNCTVSRMRWSLSAWHLTNIGAKPLEPPRLGFPTCLTISLNFINNLRTKTFQIRNSVSMSYI